MHIFPVSNKYQIIINRLKKDTDYKVLEDRNGWIALYKGRFYDGKGKDELIRRIVEPSGQEKIIIKNTVPELLKKALILLNDFV